MTEVFRCPEHPDVGPYHGYGGWYVHNKKYHDGKLKPLKEGGEVGTGSPPPPPKVLPVPAPQPSPSFRYPSLSSWKSQAAPIPETGVPPSPVSPPPPPPGLDTTAWWKWVAELENRLLLKNTTVRIDMDRDKAVMLDKAVQALGIIVKPPEHPINLEPWMPLLITGVGIFGLPIMAAIPEWQARQKERELVRFEEEKE